MSLQSHPETKNIHLLLTAIQSLILFFFLKIYLRERDTESESEQGEGQKERVPTEQGVQRGWIPGP